MESISTIKGGRKLIKDSFFYHKNKTMPNGNTYWECDKRRNGSGCKVKLILDGQDHFVQQTGEYTHPPDPEEVAADKLRIGMKRTARVGNATTNNVISQSLLG